MGLDAVQTGFDSVFAVVPWMIGFALMSFVLMRVVGPFASEAARARQIARNAAREQIEAARKRKELVSAEIVLRGEFDEWLDAEVLRLQIDCVANPGNSPLVEVLSAVTKARAENGMRITELHQGAGKQPSAEDVESIRQHWQHLRNWVGSAQTIPA